MSTSSKALTGRELADKFFVSLQTLKRLLETLPANDRPGHPDRFLWRPNWQVWAKQQLGFTVDCPPDSETRRRLHFPLNVLAIGPSPLERIDALISWCRLQVGRAVDSEIEPSFTVYPSQAQVKYDDLRAFHLGGQILNISGSDPASCLQRHSQIDEGFTRAKRATVDIPISHVWRTVYALRKEPRSDSPPMTYTQFAVLCAVRSKLGRKVVCTCTVPEIQRRALGYLTAAEMENGLPQRTDGVTKPLSRQNIRTALDTLVKWQVLRRFTPFIGKVAKPCWFWVDPKLGKRDVAALAMDKHRKRKPGLRTTARAERAVDRYLSQSVQNEILP